MLWLILYHPFPGTVQIAWRRLTLNSFVVLDFVYTLCVVNIPTNKRHSSLWFWLELVLLQTGTNIFGSIFCQTDI
jgi:hypothetical protein